MSRQIPEIRFKEFTDEWEQRKFKEFSKKTGKKNSKGLDFPAYSVSNKVGLIAQNDQFDGSRLNNMEKTSYKFVEPNEFTYNPARINVGSIAFNNMNKTVIVSSLYVVVRMSQALNNEFIFQYLKSPIFIKEVRRNTEGSVREYLFYENFSNIKLPYTKNTNEQNKIGTFFKYLDDTITLHLAAIQRQQDLKKAMLQKLFPINEATIPTVRFTSFTEEWEQRKLEDITQITMGQSPNGENYTENPDDYILVQGNADMKNGRVTPRVWTTQITKTAEPNDIILSVRAPVGDVGKTDYNVVLGRGVAGIRGNDFIYQYLIKLKTIGFWTRYSTGSTFESINSTDIKEALITVPSDEEQQIIGAFLKTLEDTTTLHQLALEKLKLLKQSLLQKMFVN